MRRALACAALAVLAAGAGGVGGRAGPRVAAASPPPDRLDAPAAVAALDAVVALRLKALGVEPAPPCSDAAFVRRAYLDVLGTIPTLAEARAFLADRRPDKRGRLVDELVERDAFADHAALRLCRVLRVRAEFPVNLWPHAAQTYHRWVRDALRDRMPFDRFAHALLTASGSSVRVPPANFWRAVPRRDPATLAASVALTFLGARTERWPKARAEGFAALFARVGYKTTAEWKEEVVFFDRTRPSAKSAALPDDTPVRLAPDEDPRRVFAAWLAGPGRRELARALANRVCAWLVGEAPVEEADDLGPHNPPSHPELLDLLEREVLRTGFDLVHLHRVLLRSSVYQRAVRPSEAAGRTAPFAARRLRRLDAEVLIDAVNAITGTTEDYESRVPEPWSYLPTDQRAVALPDPSVTSPFLELFGRSPRVTGRASESEPGLPTEAQRLHLLNSTHVRRKVSEGPALGRLVRSFAWPREAYDAVYLTVLSRYPTPEEVEAVADHRGEGQSVADTALDLAWALLNTIEFQCGP